MSKIVIPVQHRKPIPVTLGDKEYLVRPLKGSTGMKLAELAEGDPEDVKRMKSLLDTWLLASMGKKQAEAIQARLDDPADDLDLTHLMELMQALTAETSGNPTM